MAGFVPAWAKAPQTGGAAPGVNRIRIGATEVTALSDGFLDIELGLFPGLDPARAKALLEASFRSPQHHRSSTNAYVVNDGARLVVVDAGTPKGVFPNLARFQDSFRSAGFDPAAVDLVVLTHMHPDHVGGLLGPDGAAFFPNAELAVHEAEYAFWTDPALLGNAPDGMKPFVQIAQNAVKPYAARVRRFTGGQEVAPGLSALHLPGHTPGHSALRVASGNAQLLIWGDIIHAQALQFPDPKITIGFDADQNLARASRAKVLDMVTADRLLVAGMHLDFPGFGHVAKRGEGYDYVPAPFGYGI